MRRTSSHVCAFEFVFFWTTTAVTVYAWLPSSGHYYNPACSSLQISQRIPTCDYQLVIHNALHILNTQTWRLVFKRCDCDDLIGRLSVSHVSLNGGFMDVIDADHSELIRSNEYDFICAISLNHALVECDSRTFAMGSSHGPRPWMPQLWTSKALRFLTWAKWA